VKEKKFALVPGGPLRLRVTSEGTFSTTTRLFLDGAPLGEPLDKSELQRGQTYELPDGSLLTVQLVNLVFWPELRLIRNGSPIPGSATDPFEIVKGASGIIYFLGIVNVTIGAIGLAFPENRLAFGIDQLVLGLIYLALGFFTSHGSLIALGLGSSIYALDTFLILKGWLQAAQFPGWALFMRTVLLFGLGRAVKAAIEIRTMRPQAVKPTPSRTTLAPARPAAGPLSATNAAVTIAPAVAREPVRMDAAAAARIGTRLGDWELVECLGIGGMATVYRARDSGGREAALKVIRPELAITPEFSERFRRECDLARRLDHPRIVKILDHGEHEGASYLVMELHPKGTLADLVKKGRMPTRVAARIVSQVAAALDEAHKHEIVHRDVKPANILLDARGEPQLSDFGVARLADAASSLTRTGLHVGSPLYMSPEQWQGGGVDARADVYALGVIAFEMLTASAPFAADSPAAIMRLHLDGAIPSAASLRPELPPAVDDFFETALSKDPAQRFQSAGALATALSHALTAGPAAVARRAPTSRRSRQPVSAPVGAAVLLVAVLAILAIIRVQLPSSPARPAATAAPSASAPPATTPTLPPTPATPPPTPVPDNALLPVKEFPLGAIISRIAISPDRKYAFLMNATHSKIQRMDLERREWDGEVSAPGASDMSLSASGQVLFVCAPASKTTGVVQLFDTAPLRVSKTWTIPLEPRAIAARNDDSAFVSGDGRHESRLALVNEGGVAASVNARLGESQLRLSALGRLYSDTPGTWSVLSQPIETNPRDAFRYAPYSGSPNSGLPALGGPFEISPDGKLLVARKGTVLRLSVSNEDDMRYLGSVSPHSAAAFDAKGNRLIVAPADGRLQFYGYPALDHQKTFVLPKPAYQLAVDESRGLILAALGDGQSRLAGPPTARPVVLIEMPPAPVGDRPRVMPKPLASDALTPDKEFPSKAHVRRVALTRDRRYAFVLNGTDSKVQRMDLQRREWDGEVDVAPGTIDMSLSPSGRVLFSFATSGVSRSSKAPGTVQVIDASRLRVSQTLALTFNPNAIEARDDNTAYVSGMGELSAELVLVDTRQAGVAVTAPAKISPDSRIRLSALGRLYYGGGSYIGVLDEPIETARASSLKNSLDRQSGFGGTFEISPDGTLLVASLGKVLRLSKDIRTDMVSHGMVPSHRALTFDARRKLVMLALDDGKLEIRAYPSLELRKTFVLPKPAYQLAYDESRGLVVAALDDDPAALGFGTLVIFRMPKLP
jgi:serine/threonine-protein kinase